MQRNGAARLSRRDFFALFDPVTLTFDLIFTGWQGIVMNYPCAKFGDFSFSRFDTDRQTDRQTDRITEVDQRYTHATTVGMSNYEFNSEKKI